MIYDFFVKGIPLGKPRMTRRDKWKQRPCVMKYRQWADRIRAELIRHTGMLCMDLDIIEINIKASFDMPKSWSKKKKISNGFSLHRQKPDCDNILKGVMDAICKQDQRIAKCSCKKYWTFGVVGVDIQIRIMEK